MLSWVLRESGKEYISYTVFFKEGLCSDIDLTSTLNLQNILKTQRFHYCPTKAVVSLLKLVPKFKASYTRACQMVREPNARMCGRDCELALRPMRMVRVPFATNQNLSVFCANTKKTGFAGCPFHAPGVLCSPQVRGKLTNGAPNTCGTWTAQRVSGTLVYTRFKDVPLSEVLNSSWRDYVLVMIMPCCSAQQFSLYMYSFTFLISVKLL